MTSEARSDFHGPKETQDYQDPQEYDESEEDEEERRRRRRRIRWSKRPQTYSCSIEDWAAAMSCMEYFHLAFSAVSVMAAFMLLIAVGAKVTGNIMYSIGAWVAFITFFILGLINAYIAAKIFIMIEEKKSAKTLTKLLICFPLVKLVQNLVFVLGIFFTPPESSYEYTNTISLIHKASLYWIFSEFVFSLGCLVVIGGYLDWAKKYNVIDGDVGHEVRFV